MSIRELLSRSSDEIEPVADGELDFDPSRASKYAIRRYRPGQSGAVAVSGFDDLGEPIKKSHFAETVEHEGLPYGTYKLLALGGERNQIIGTIWSLEDVGSRSALDREDSVDEELAAIREQLRDQDTEPRIEEPGDAFGLIAEEIVAGDLDLGEEELDRLRNFLIDWRKATRSPSVDLLAYQMAVALVDEGETEVALQILFAWLDAERGTSDVDLLELARDGDLSEIGEIDLPAVAALRFLDAPRQMSQEVAGGLLEAAGEQREAGVEVDLGEE